MVNSKKIKDNFNLLESTGSYDPKLERDACGVGFVANIFGKESNWILEQSLKGLDCMEHRGGCGGDGDSGDGAGILCSIPWTFLSKYSDFEIDNTKNIGLGMIFKRNL